MLTLNESTPPILMKLPLMDPNAGGGGEAPGGGDKGWS